MSDYVAVNINGEPKSAMLVAAASINATANTNTNAPVLWRSKIGTGGLPSGRIINFAGSIKSSPNTLLEIATTTATGTGAVFVNAGGYEG